MTANLPTLAELCDPDIDAALDRLFAAVDDALYAGHELRSWPDLDHWIRSIDPAHLSPELIVGVLMATLPVQRQPWRRTWASRATLAIRIMEPAEAAEILRGLVQ